MEPIKTDTEDIHSQVEQVAIDPVCAITILEAYAFEMTARFSWRKEIQLNRILYTTEHEGRTGWIAENQFFSPLPHKSFTCGVSREGEYIICALPEGISVVESELQKVCPSP